MRQQSIVCFIIATAAGTGACTFQTPDAGNGVDAPPNNPGTDAPVARDAALGVDSTVTPPIDGPPPQVLCSTSDSALELCIEFEDSNLVTALDGSGNQHDASLTAATAATRDVPAISRAIAIGSSTSVLVPDSSDFNLQTVTLTAWLQRGALPASGQSFGVVDIGRRQAALTIDSSGRVSCFVKTDNTLFFRPGGTTTLNEWTLAACTYDAPTLCTYVFKNGSATPSVTCGSTDGESLDTSATSGAAIGALFDTSDNPSSRFNGKLDSVRIYSRALTEAQICAAGGLTGC